MTGPVRARVPLACAGLWAALAAAPAHAIEPLLLDVRVNGQRLADVVQAGQLADGRVVLPRSSWQDMRLRAPTEILHLPDGQAGHALEAATDLRYTLDRRRLQLDIEAPASQFLGQSLRAGGGATEAPPRPGLGAVLNYDISLSRRAAGGAGGVFETVVFGPFGSLVTSALAASGDAADGGHRRLARLDTAWQIDWPERMDSLVVGDTVGTGGGWSRPVRYGGVRFGRDFALQPGFVSVPQATLGGSAALPSAVDILVNGQQRMSQSVQPGAFEITHVPLVSGAGEVNLVVRDLLGRETVVRQSYYSSPRILADGVSDYVFEAGRLRTGYGASADDYGDAFAAATWRQGLSLGGSLSLTAEGRVEWMRERKAAGLEVAGLMGHWGVARGLLAASRTAQQSGLRWGVGLERSAATGGLHMMLEGFGRGFTQLGAVPGEAQPRQRVLLGAWAPLGGRASAAATWTRQTSWNTAGVGVLGVTLNLSVLRSTSLALSLGRQSGSLAGWRAGLSLAVPLGNGAHMATSVDRAGDGSVSASAHASQTVPSAGGLGWHLRASDRQAAALTGGIYYNGPSAELAAEAQAARDGRTDMRLGMRGSMGWAGGLAFASRPLGREAFAVVQVGDLAGVPVLRSHQVVAYTNEKGLALVPGLQAYETNLIAVDTSELPLDAEVGHLQLKLTPYARSAVVADFALKRRRSALVELVQPDGNHVPLGARVRPVGAPVPFGVARRGEVYLENLPPQAEIDIDVRWGEQRCTARVPLGQRRADSVPRIGPLVCTPSDGAWVASS